MVVFMNLNYTWYIIMSKDFRFVKDSPQISLISFLPEFPLNFGRKFFNYGSQILCVYL